MQDISTSFCWKRYCSNINKNDLLLPDTIILFFQNEKKCFWNDYISKLHITDNICWCR